METAVPYYAAELIAEKSWMIRNSFSGRSEALCYLVEGKDSFIGNVIRLVHDLKKEMTIEGVEENWQYVRLREFGADTIQGFYFSKPLPADQAIVFKPEHCE